MEEYDVDKVIANIFNNNDGNTWKPSDKIPLVAKEIELLKADLQAYVNNSEYDIVSICSETKDKCKASTLTLFDIETCQKEIEEDTMVEIQNMIENHDELTKQLKCIEYEINIIFDVIQCSRYVKDFESAREAKSYNRAVEVVNDLVTYLNLQHDDFKSLDFYTNIKQASDDIIEIIHNCLNEQWESLVKWDVSHSPESTKVKMVLKLDNTHYVGDVLRALDNSNKLVDKVSEFARFFLNIVLLPIIRNDCVVLSQSIELVNITINHRRNSMPSHEAVIANLKTIFSFMSDRVNYEYEKGKTIMRLIGNEISGEFRGVLIKECLIDTIPTNLNDLQAYTKLTSDVLELERYLAILMFFPATNFCILDYVQDVDMLFADKSCQHFLESARTIMLKDLSATMAIGVQTIQHPSVKGMSSKNFSIDETIMTFESAIPTSLFYFPRCMISKSAQELLDLVYSTMELVVQCPDVMCKKIYETTRLMFELYEAVVPYHHEKYLQTIPQYVALFHNNCMYLAHNLQTLGDKWMRLMEGKKVDYPLSFVDLVQKLRDLAYRHITMQMQQQRKQILDNLRSSDLNCIVVKDVLGENVEAAIRQCLRQLQLLRNVWIGVFPGNVFTNLMGTLVNMFVEELIHRVCTVEDISMEMATQLTELYSIVVQKAPLFFKEPKDVDKNVYDWGKLEKLIFILGGSLKDIEQEWDNGSGPLSVWFTPDELRNLIKALFQNTQIRANLLSKIK